MHPHSLTFSKDEIQQLHRLYDTLTTEMEQGEGCSSQFYTRLQQTLQTLLHAQVLSHPLPHAPHPQAQQPPQHLHLTHPDKAILNLPWQIALDTDKVYLSKGIPATQALPAYHPLPGPLRVLVMISSPEDLEPGKRLSYEQEEQVILSALGPLWETGQVQVDFTADGSLQGLRSQLAGQSYHILYFSGHGMYENDTGYLRLENAYTLESEYVPARELAEAVIEGYPPPLVILASCQTAQGDTKEGFRGVADELLYAGIPAAIAMAFSITDRYAIVFAAQVFRQLAARQPLTEAYTRALSAMRDDEQQQLIKTGRDRQVAAQWLVPQLYCSREITHIVDWQTPAPQATPAQPATLAPQATPAAKLIGGATFLLLSPDKDYHFIGRRRESALAFGQLTRLTPVLLRGQGGVGKTAMAEHLAKRLITQDPTRYGFAFTETDIGLAEMITRLRHYLEKQGRLADIEFELEKCAGATNRLDLLLEQTTQCCKPFFIFDNLESCQEDIGGPLRPEYTGWVIYVRHRLLPRFPVLFTGRYPIPELPGLVDIALNQVSLADFRRKCLQLRLRTIHQNGGPPLFKTAALLYDTLGGSYRILEFVDEIYAHDPSRMAQLLDAMQSIHTRAAAGTTLRAQVQERLAGDAKKIVFSALLALLTEQEKSTLSFLFYFRWPILQRALEMQLPDRDFAPHLRRLKDLTLIEQQTRTVDGPQPGDYSFYYMTPLVRDGLEDCSIPRVEFYPDFAGDYFEQLFYQTTRDFADMDRAFSYYAYNANIPRINRVAAFLVSEYYRIGLYDLVLFFGTRTEALAGVHTDEEVLNNLGITYLKFGKFDLALQYLTKFLILIRRKGDKRKETIALNSIGQVYYGQQQFDNALIWTDKSRLMAKENHFPEDEAIALTNIGNVYVDRQQYENALDTFRKSLQIRKATGNRQGEIRALGNIGMIHSARGDHPKAIRTLQKGIAIAVEIADKRLEASQQVLLGMEYQKLEEFDTALRHLKKGLTLSEEIHDQEGIGRALTGLASAYKMLNMFDTAIECLVRGSAILQRFGYTEMDTGASWNLANIYNARGDYAEALPILLELLPALRTGDDRERLGETLNDIAADYLHLGDVDKAIPYWEESLPVLRSLDDKPSLGETLQLLSQAYAVKGDRARFLECAEQAYAIYTEINDLKGLYYTGVQLGLYYCLTDEPGVLPRGLSLLQQSHEIGLQSDLPGVEDLAKKIKRFTAKQKKQRSKTS